MTYQNEYTLTVDIKKKGINQIPIFVKNDTAILKLKFLDDDVEYDISTADRYTVSFKKPSGEKVTGQGRYENGMMVYELGATEMDEVGTLEVIAQVYIGETRISTRPFQVKILDDIENGIASQEQLTLLQELFIEVDNHGNYAKSQGDYAKLKGDNLGHKGNYSATVVYKDGNVVTYGGVNYICIKDTTMGIDPTNGTYWTSVSPQASINEQTWTATEGQTVFTLTNGRYVLGKGNIEVWVGGVPQIKGQGYTESSETTFTLTEGLPVGTIVYAKWFEGHMTITKGHKSGHELGGQDEIDVTKLKNYNVISEQLAESAQDIDLALGTGLLGEKYPRLTGETDDAPRYQRALNDLKTAGGGRLVLPNKPITISSNIKADPTNGSIVIEGSGSSKIIVATDNLTYGFTIGQTCYNQKNINLNHNVTLQNVEFEASGTPKGGIFVEPGAFMPIIKNVKLKGFKGDGACIYVYNDGYNNATLSKYSWVDNATFEDIVCENVKNGIWFVGNVQRAGETGQTSNEDTFSQTKLKNCLVQVTVTGGHAYHFEGSFARSVFDGDISFMEGAALTDVQTNRDLATSYHYFLKGNFRAASFISLGAEGGGWVIRLDSSMLPDANGDNGNLDNLGTWINTGWLNIPDSTRKLLKIIDPTSVGNRAMFDTWTGSTVKSFRRDGQQYILNGRVKIVGDTSLNSGYQTYKVILPKPLLEVEEVQVTIDLSHLTSADRVLYSARVDNFGVDSYTISNGKTTEVTFYVKVNTNTSQGVGIRYKVVGRTEHQWDYYYA